jgi:hypothetical protein
MADSDRYTAIADQMLRLASASTTDFERNGYIELSRAWRKLAGDAAAVERRSQAEGAIRSAARQTPDR